MIGMHKEYVWAWVNGEIKDLVREVARAQGITVSEYVRSLVLQDLNKRGLISSKSASSEGRSSAVDEIPIVYQVRLLCKLLGLNEEKIKVIEEVLTMKKQLLRSQDGGDKRDGEA